MTAQPSRLPAATIAEKWQGAKNLGLMLACVLGGKLSLMLAVPPGFVTALFMPAGIALAGVLIGGYGTLPWTFLGYLLFAAWNGGIVHGNINALVVAAMLLLACAGTLQAGLGGLILRRALGPSVWMDHGRQILRFCLLTPLVCTISATLYVAGFFALGMLPAGLLISAWCIWWVGDTLGALIMVPLIMMLCAEPRALWRGRMLTAGVPMLLGLLLFIGIFLRYSVAEKQQSLGEFDRLSQQVADRIQTRLEGQEVFLQQAGMFLGGPHLLTRERFREHVGRFAARDPAVASVQWAPQVKESDRAAYEARHGFRIQDYDGGSRRLVPASARPVYYPVSNIEPAKGNDAVLGLDLANTSVPTSALEAAIDAGHVLVTAPMPLMQNRDRPDRQHAVMVIYPVPGDAGVSGLVATVIRVAQFMDDALPVLQGQLSVRLSDREARAVLYDTFDADAKPQFQVSLHFGGREYLLQTTPSAQYLQTHRSWQSWAILVAGLSFTVLLGMALLLSTGHAARTQALVDLRTADVNDANHFLETIINSLPGVFYMLDRRGNLTRWNRNLEALLGLNGSRVNMAAVLQKVCDRDRERVKEAARVVYATRGYQALEIRQQGADGVARHFLVNGQYIEISGRAYIFGTGLDVTEIHQTRSRLQSANAELERRVEEIHSLQTQLREQVIRDPLSGLYNRRYLDETLDRELSKAKRGAYPVSFIMGDIDRFKALNDTYGHRAGDEVIRALARLLREQARAGDILCRYGGEEFMLVLPGLGGDAAHERVDEWRMLFSKLPVNVGDVVISATISFGLSTYPQHGSATVDLIAAADEALYRAKARGRNCVVRFGPAASPPGAEPRA